MKANKIYKKEDIINHLEEIKKSLEDDVGNAVKWYAEYFLKNKEGKGIGLFAIPRIIFPEIDNLGCYLSGNINNTAKNAVNFIRKYFGKINPEYKDIGGFIYLVYRHGLMHQHTPKLVSYKKKILGWAISLSGPNNVTNSHLEKFGDTIQIDGKQLYEDLIVGIDFYIKDFENSNKNKKLIKNFSAAFYQMNRPISKSACLKKGKGNKKYKRGYIKQSDFKFLK